MLCWRRVCEGVEFRVCLRVESLDFRVEGCEFGGFRVFFCFFWVVWRVASLLVLGFRIWFQVVGSAACRGMSLAFENWGVSGLGLRA